MEFGATFVDDVVYMRDTETDTPTNKETFRQRAETWLKRNGVSVEEVSVHFLDFGEEQAANCYKFQASKISGPDNLVERILD